MGDLRITARKGESIDQLIRRFRKRCEREGLVREYKRHQYYEKPSEKQRREERKSKSRQRKLELERTGKIPMSIGRR
ncbi:MAG TPA: 30S ribosomal protein S21 [Planctomycetota bacterium]|nr:30S ribosomal protein S21 [Planctomycetota bacterium]HUW34862.1 30S ribosomal protein S21 [Planctomycetota bacterium]